MSIYKYDLTVITDAVAGGSMPETKLLSNSGSINLLIAHKWVQRSWYDRTAGLILLLNSCDIEQSEIFIKCYPPKSNLLQIFYLCLVVLEGRSLTRQVGIDLFCGYCKIKTG